MTTANRGLKANELVMLLAGLLNLDVEMLARVGNVPVRNLKSWLAGKKENLRPQSVINLMGLMGLTVGGSGIRLDDTRVHYWNLSDGMFTRSKSAYQALTSLSKLIVGCHITRVLPQKTSFADKRHVFYFVSGVGVRLVICVSKSFWKKAHITPEVIKGASWRDDNDHHSIRANARLWNHLVERDLTTFEFDQIFNQVAEVVTWADVSLMAREFGVTAADVSGWISDRFGDQTNSRTEDDSAGMDLEGGGKLLFFVGNKRRSA